jgi:hypothetical protein
MQVQIFGILGALKFAFSVSLRRPARGTLRRGHSVTTSGHWAAAASRDIGDRLQPDRDQSANHRDSNRPWAVTRDAASEAASLQSTSDCMSSQPARSCHQARDGHQWRGIIEQHAQTYCRIDWLARCNVVATLQGLSTWTQYLRGKRVRATSTSTAHWHPHRTPHAPAHPTTQPLTPTPALVGSSLGTAPHHQRTGPRRSASATADP